MPDPTDPESSQPRSAKAEETRRAIVTAAMRLFREGGYDKTTMRAIANEAGVSTGNAYYYFASKEHLIQAYYSQVQELHQQAAAPVLCGGADFGTRLSGVLLAWVDVAAPYHEFAGKFFKNAAEPSSPLSPFSSESARTRAEAITLMGAVLDGSDLKVTPALRSELPELLWLLQMGIVLFWVYDESAGQRRTRQLVTGAVPVVDRLIRLTRLPVVRGVTADLIALMRSVR